MCPLLPTPTTMIFPRRSTAARSRTTARPMAIAIEPVMQPAQFPRLQRDDAAGEGEGIKHGGISHGWNTDETRMRRREAVEGGGRKCPRNTRNTRRNRAKTGKEGPWFFPPPLLSACSGCSAGTLFPCLTPHPCFIRVPSVARKIRPFPHNLLDTVPRCSLQQQSTTETP